MTNFYVQESRSCYGKKATEEMIRRNIYVADLARDRENRVVKPYTVNGQVQMKRNGKPFYAIYTMYDRFQIIKTNDVLYMLQRGETKKDASTLYKGVVTGPVNINIVYCLDKHIEGQFYSSSVVREARKREWHCKEENAPSIEVQVPVIWTKISTSDVDMNKLKLNATIVKE